MSGDILLSWFVLKTDSSENHLSRLTFMTSLYLLGDKSGVGTVTLLIEDLNDNIPVIPKRHLVLCEEEGQMGSVTIEAVDPDLSPYSSPFNFHLPDGHDGKWRLKNIKSE